MSSKVDLPQPLGPMSATSSALRYAPLVGSRMTFVSVGAFWPNPTFGGFSPSFGATGTSMENAKSSNARSKGAWPNSVDGSMTDRSQVVLLQLLLVRLDLPRIGPFDLVACGTAEVAANRVRANSRVEDREEL